MYRYSILNFFLFGLSPIVKSRYDSLVGTNTIAPSATAACTESLISGDNTWSDRLVQRCKKPTTSFLILHLFLFVLYFQPIVFISSTILVALLTIGGRIHRNLTTASIRLRITSKIDKNFIFNRFHFIDRFFSSTVDVYRWE